MDNVRETLNNAGTYASETATSVGKSLGLGSNPQAEEHKSMIDGKVRSGTPGQGAQTQNAQGQQSQRTKDSETQPEGPNPGQKPQGTNVVGDDGMSQNKNPMSNKNEPNTGFGGGSGNAEPSVDAMPKSGAEGAEGASGSQQKAGGAAGGGSMGGGAAEGTGMKLPESQSSEEGTGTKYEKSTGMKADGGDFDATRPGAGREADRLMEEKGIKHGVAKSDNKGGPTDDKDSESHGKSGHGGLGEKIKGKLHH